MQGFVHLSCACSTSRTYQERRQGPGRARLALLRVRYVVQRDRAFVG